MDHVPNESADLWDFSGSAPLFPLPGVVFYPHSLLPLHVFEPRYRRMTADALDGPRLIAMALLRPGWERLPETSVPPIYEMVCLGKITAEERLPDGRYYLTLRGLSRARIVRETSANLPYRVGELDLCADDDASLTSAEDQLLREELVRTFQALYPNLSLNPLFVPALDSRLPLGMLCDIFAQALRLAPAESQALLEELNVSARGQRVLGHLRSEVAGIASAELHFPPKFSRN